MSTSGEHQYIDKENPTETTALNSNKLQTQSIKQKCIVNSTPIRKIIDDRNSELNSAIKRKALGDLLNTTKTNKQLLQNVLNNTPKLKTNIINDYTSAKKINAKNIFVDYKQKIENNADDYLEERFIRPPIDTFNDLFENGRLSELVFNKKIKYVPNLPIGKVMINDTSFLKEINVLNDKDWNSSIKDEAQIECTKICKDIPKLEDLAFKIPDNFDLIL